MQISKIYHRDEWRICLQVDYDEKIVAKIRQLTNAKWSRTLRAWHVPYSSEAYKELTILFPEATVLIHQTEVLKKETELSVEDIQPTQQEASPSFSTSTNYSTQTKSVEIKVSGRQIAVRLPKNNTDIDFLKTFTHVRWDKIDYQWIVPHWGNNLNLLKNYFNNRIGKIDFVPQVTYSPHIENTIT